MEDHLYVHEWDVGVSLHLSEFENDDFLNDIKNAFSLSMTSCENML